MKFEGEGKLLRIFIGESDRFGSKPLYQALVEKAPNPEDSLEQPCWDGGIRR